jgi:hypothetical protein
VPEALWRAVAVLPSLQRSLRKVDEPEAKAAVIWMIGEYGEVSAWHTRPCSVHFLLCGGPTLKHRRWHCA